MAQLTCIGLLWPLTKPPFGSCAVYFHHRVNTYQLASKISSINSRKNRPWVQRRASPELRWDHCHLRLIGYHGGHGGPRPYVQYTARWRLLERRRFWLWFSHSFVLKTERSTFWIPCPLSLHVLKCCMSISINHHRRCFSSKCPKSKDHKAQ